MPHFPMFVDLKGKQVLVIGGGTVAQRKAQKLAHFGCCFRVIAPEILPQLEEMEQVIPVKRSFLPRDLEPAPALVLAASDDREANSLAAKLCAQRGIPVNVADAPGESSFLFPALVTRGSFSAGFCTGGASPTAAVHCKEQLDAFLPEQFEQILEDMERRRRQLKQQIPEQSRRAAMLRMLLDASLKKGSPLEDGEAEAILSGKETGKVYLVGAGCGKADLITLRGLRALQRCQAVVYDALIDEALLDAAPETALRICAGKRGGRDSMHQEQINEILVSLAHRGLAVVRLKGGDPYLFGRGGEEAAALKEAGIPFEEVPGISSAVAIPAEAGIPVTHRNVSRQLHIITGHTADTADGLPENLEQLATLPGTLVILMGLGKLERIVSRLLEGGMAPEMSAAVISGGNSPKPACIRAPLAQLPAAVRQVQVQPPAIILIGPTARMEL